MSCALRISWSAFFVFCFGFVFFVYVRFISWVFFVRFDGGMRTHIYVEYDVIRVHAPKTEFDSF